MRTLMNGNSLEPLSTRFGKLYLRLYRLLDRRLAGQGASLARAKLLFYLGRYGASRAADIAEHFNQAPRTVTEAIDGLERQGLVRREDDPVDRRAKRVSLTAAGQSALERVEPLRLRLVQQIFGALSEAERCQLDAILATLENALDAEEEFS
jgi:DNA-binding MarR family transcriptional regulator